uniref:Uncharacterized protein n=1 Tax=Arundo donax TaxID=35708 RepID=A0A0A9G9T1_ARUDO
MNNEKSMRQNHKAKKDSNNSLPIFQANMETKIVAYVLHSLTTNV